MSKTDNATQFAVRHNSGDYLMTLENGLSIYAPEEITGLAGTDKSFGGTYNNGLIIAATKEPSPRLVLISLDYINREIEKLN